MRRIRRAFLLCVPLFLVFIVACASPTSPPQPTPTATSTSTPTRTPTPAPLARVIIEPAQITLEPGETYQFTVKALDVNGKAIARVNLSWAAVAESGTVDPSGLFTAGEFSNAVSLTASSGGVSRQAQASVVINPGPVARASINPAEATLYTGESSNFKVEAFDRYDNAVTDVDASWAVPTGQMDRIGRFTAGRQPGDFNVTATVSDGRTVVTSNSVIKIKQGFCEIRGAETSWDAEWFRLKPDGSSGSSLGKITGKLSFDVGFGPVFAGQPDRVILNAHTTIVVQRQGPVRFTVGGDDGFRLSMDEKLVFEDWTTHSYREQSKFLWLNPGIHSVKLDYFESTGLAKLQIATDTDVVRWQEATKCFGRFTEPPQGRYFLYTPAGETLDQVADRFGIAWQEIAELNPIIGSRLLLPGLESGESPKVIVIQGINSSASCNDAQDDPNSLWSRRTTLIRALQLIPSTQPGESSLIDADDVIGFSYSGNYVDCDTGLMHKTQNIPLNNVPHPIYTSEETCGGVRDAAQKLEALVNRIRDLEPNSRFVFIGHSMGGLVATYYVSQLSPEFGSKRIQAVVTLDSPLRGTEAETPWSACDSTDRSWQDIHGETDVVEVILGINNSVRTRFLAINSTRVGDSIPGTRTLEVPCAGGGPLLGAILGAVLLGPLGVVLGAPAGEFVAGHGCAFYDEQALTEISSIVN